MGANDTVNSQFLKAAFSTEFLPIHVLNKSKWPKITRKFLEIFEKDIVLSAAPW